MAQPTTNTLTTVTSPADVSPVRVRALVDVHFAFAGRLTRHLGVASADIDDLVQQAFAITAARLSDIEPGKERAFLAEVVVRLSANVRRANAHRREVPVEDAGELTAPEATPEERLAEKQALAILDGLLEAMDSDLRAVFVLYEIEEWTMAEIAVSLRLAPGTVASRLRRARDDFQLRLARVHRGKRETP